MKSLEIRVGKIEQAVRGENSLPAVACLTSDGRYRYEGHVYESEQAFKEAVDKLFDAQPEKERSKVIVLES